MYPIRHFYPDIITRRVANQGLRGTFSSPHEVRLTPLDTNPVFQCLGVLSFSLFYMSSCGIMCQTNKQQVLLCSLLSLNMFSVFSFSIFEQGSNKNTGSRDWCNEIYYLRHYNISNIALVLILSNSMEQI